MTVTMPASPPPNAPGPARRIPAGTTTASEAGLWLEIERSRRLRAACEALLPDPKPFAEAPAAPLCETVSVRRAPQSAWVRLWRRWPKITGSGPAETAAFVRAG